MYTGPPCNGYALNWRLVYLAKPGTRPLCMKKQYICLFYLYATAKNEIHICSNKHETGLVPSVYVLAEKVCLICFFDKYNVHVCGGSKMIHGIQFIHRVLYVHFILIKSTRMSDFETPI